MYRATRCTPCLFLLLVTRVSPSRLSGLSAVTQIRQRPSFYALCKQWWLGSCERPTSVLFAMNGHRSPNGHKAGDNTSALNLATRSAVHHTSPGRVALVGRVLGRRGWKTSSRARNGGVTCQRQLKHGAIDDSPRYSTEPSGQTILSSSST